MTGASGGDEMAGLPLRCHVVLPGLPAGANVAVCERGSHGVRITSIDLGGFSTARRLVRALNDALTHSLRFTLADTATSLDVEAFSHYSAMPLPRTTRPTLPNLPLAPRRNKFLRPTRTSSAYSSPRETATW